MAPRGTAGTSAPIDISHLEKSGILEFRRRHGLTGAGVTIGVIDSGVDASHPDLAGKISASAEIGADGRVRQAAPVDHFGHGTQVCGVIAGAHTGVAPGARLASANIFPDPGRAEYGLSQFAAALDWLLEAAHADIVNVSVGHEGEIPEYLPLVRSAREKYGVLVIAAIGNSGGAPNHDDSPGNLPDVFGVGACNSAGIVWARSDWRTRNGAVAIAPKPEMCAPGVSVCTCKPGGGYTAATATSIAAAIMSGVAALCIEQDPALRRDPTGLTNTLLSKARPVRGMHAGRAGRGILSA